ncbi:MAG: hypothetical protein E6K70_04645 [Planctomycetota bacterium]|nr:MAG: hypothetical protein E6K70_04645 [Planctomycetota bacterium]
MLPVFCLRLAGGMVGALLLLSPAQINPRFYRTHFLTALGLAIVAAVFLRESADLWLWAGLGGSILFSFLGSLAWSLERAPGGRALIVLATVALTATLLRLPFALSPEDATAWSVANELTSAAVLGAAFTAMLMGHSYLLAPAMVLTPLLRLIGLLFVSIAVRAGIGGASLWLFWTAEHSLTNVMEVLLWLPVRWGLGLLLPFVLGVMAWKTARIRSTQSATGILYVVVIFCFLGELLSQLLCRLTGYFL